MDRQIEHEVMSQPIEGEIREKWEREQEEKRKKLIIEDVFPWTKNCQIYEPDTSDAAENRRTHVLRYIAGVDISFVKDDNVNACAAVVVISLPDMKLVYKDLQMIALTEPYIPGFLAFREMPSLASMMRNLVNERPDVAPQAILVDGNGILHPKRFGSACHLGLEVNVPTIGVAKNLFHVDGIANDDSHKNKIKSDLLKGGDSFPLVTENGDTLAAALRTKDETTSPVYVSPGHMISLESAVWVVNQCCKHRFPEPVRMADILSREYLREIFPTEENVQHGKTKKSRRKEAEQQGINAPT